jgi:hypothetical protein
LALDSDGRIPTSAFRSNMHCADDVQHPKNSTQYALSEGGTQDARSSAGLGLDPGPFLCGTTIRPPQSWHTLWPLHFCAMSGKKLKAKRAQGSTEGHGPLLGWACSKRGLFFPYVVIKYMEQLRRQSPFLPPTTIRVFVTGLISLVQDAFHSLLPFGAVTLLIIVIHF